MSSTLISIGVSTATSYCLGQLKCLPRPVCAFSARDNIKLRQSRRSTDRPSLTSNSAIWFFTYPQARGSTSSSNLCSGIELQRVQPISAQSVRVPETISQVCRSSLDQALAVWAAISCTPPSTVPRPPCSLTKVPQRVHWTNCRIWYVIHIWRRGRDGSQAPIRSG